jgi:hypothetical protein
MKSDTRNILKKMPTKKRSAVNKLLDLVGKDQADRVVTQCQTMPLKEIKQMVKHLDLGQDAVRSLAVAKANYEWRPTDNRFRIRWKNGGLEIWNWKLTWLKRYRWAECWRKGNINRSRNWNAWQLTYRSPIRKLVDKIPKEDIPFYIFLALATSFITWVIGSALLGAK